MIVDLARNDLARVALIGSAEVEPCTTSLAWSGLWHASSLVAADPRRRGPGPRTSCGRYCQGAR